MPHYIFPLSCLVAPTLHHSSPPSLHDALPISCRPPRSLRNKPSGSVGPAPAAVGNAGTSDVLTFCARRWANGPWATILSKRRPGGVRFARSEERRVGKEWRCWWAWAQRREREEREREER